MSLLGLFNPGYRGLQVQVTLWINRHISRIHGIIVILLPILYTSERAMSSFFYQKFKKLYRSFSSLSCQSYE